MNLKPFRFIPQWKLTTKDSYQLGRRIGHTCRQFSEDVTIDKIRRLVPEADPDALTKGFADGKKQEGEDNGDQR